MSLIDVLDGEQRDARVCARAGVSDVVAMGQLPCPLGMSLFLSGIFGMIVVMRSREDGNRPGITKATYLHVLSSTRD